MQHSVLFTKLLEQGMPHILVRYLQTTYRLQRANVKWNNEASYFFDIGNGVKQGAVLSAVFYCVYTNVLFEELRRMNIGCCIGQNGSRAVTPLTLTSRSLTPGHLPDIYPPGTYPPKLPPGHLPHTGYFPRRRILNVIE